MSDTISAVLQTRKNHVTQSVPSTVTSRKIRIDKNAPLSAAEVLKNNDNQDLWEWVEIPDHDLFGEEHTGVSVNFDAFTPGKYYVSPELAFEIKRLLANRMRGDIRVLQPRQDAVMARIMSKHPLGAPVNSELQGLND